VLDGVLEHRAERDDRFFSGAPRARRSRAVSRSEAGD
jgi:hypothetical protein